MNWLYDDRTECYSVMTDMPAGHYLDLVEPAHSAKGALSGQRDTLKTTTAKRIRDRMVSDIRRGAVLPPVVVGVVVSEEAFATYSTDNHDDDLATLMLPNDKAELSIIDGMQRTAALKEAATIDANVRSRKMRVEFWLTRSIGGMIYRMLVLNTGQVPWTLARQLSVVYSPLLKEINERVPELGRVFTPDKPGRRVASGEFSSDALVELYIAFSLRKTSVDTREALSDEFSRLDFVENLSEATFQQSFYDCLSALVVLDRSFSRYDEGSTGRFTKGRNIFDSQPARIGFVVAVAQFVLGRPGLDRSAPDRAARMEKIGREARSFADHLDGMDTPELRDFLRLDVLAETLDRRVGQVGRYERGVFFDGFSVLIDESFNLPNMEPCWRAN
ncbi:hypothetical protein [Roseitranquillus sediminis]|uniref:hypothetical protein n=1 Tax=Roseitranquillus sediminis TaxID=2809051 RepID=UPI001D0C2C05|nr:hypothetical protein [Roseitranquillus sediminis]MBM9593432.1 hypothetical protein [Roseitranquillus sediminis]